MRFYFTNSTSAKHQPLLHRAFVARQSAIARFLPARESAVPHFPVLRFTLAPEGQRRM
jgi:hypothetical protein